ncbi:putative ferric reductase transmembrane component [Candida viswanathii]|uniref:Putative ferric reductase transmembrane component n=1 Tax=Candida viswanathii TaxID=5486 RepID=A0A367YAX1_9ASCO|nr:putative ferric reductase transmembrane component [Candida viswanathii]
MIFATIYIVFVYFVAFVAALGGKLTIMGEGLVYWACDYQLDDVATFECEELKYTACTCSNKNSLASIAGCMAYNNRNTTSVIKAATDICYDFGNITLKDGWFEESYQYYLDNAVWPSDIPDFNKSEPFDLPVKFNGTYIELYYSAYDHWFGNLDNSFYYGAGALGYWLLVMFLEGVVNWSKILFPGLVKKLTFAPITWWRAYVSMPATFRKRKAQEFPILKIFDCLIPSRYESLVILGFYAYIIAVHCIKLHYVKEVPIYESVSQFRLKNIGDRTGIIATVMMPLVFLFGGRNNILQWLTGMSYNQFMTYHRHIARVMVALVIIHSVNYTVFLKSFYAEEAEEPWFYWGIIGTLAGGLILFQAMLYFRRRWYEMFLLIHITMAALYIVGTWIHVDIFGYVYFCYGTIAPWCFDRLVRIIRMFWFGFPKAQITLISNETIKVVIPKPRYWYSIPGGHAYISFFRLSCFWQNHPFTFVDAPTDKNIVMYCKVKGGMTHGLYQYLAKQPNQTASIRVGVEGPYGEPTAARYADSAVFIASGNGIPGLYSEVMYGARKLLSTSKRVMKLIWIIREYSALAWFQEELESLKDTNIQTTIYVTRPVLNLHSDEDKKIEAKDSTDDDSESIKSRLAHIEFIEGRPSIEEMVVDEINESSGSVAFVTCGHPAMVDEVRYFTAHNLRNPDHKRVDFYEQLQVWA